MSRGRKGKEDVREAVQQRNKKMKREEKRGKRIRKQKEKNVGGRENTKGKSYKSEASRMVQERKDDGRREKDEEDKKKA